MRRLLVLGGSGFVGRALCERLAAEQPDLPVVVPTRRRAHGRALLTLPTVQLVEADVHDAATLAALVAGADAVVNLIAILHGTPEQFTRVHVELPRQLAAACRRAGVRRLVHVSALGVGEGAPSHYLRSKTAGEQVLHEAGLAPVLLRPSVIFGAQDRFLNLFAALQRLAPVMPLAGRDARFQPVWVGDVAAAITRALALPVGDGRAFELAGPRVYTLAELVRLAGRWSGHERPQLPLPAALGRLQALLLEWLPGPTLMSRDNLDSMRVPNVAGGALPGLAELGITPTPLEAVAPQYLSATAGRARYGALRAQPRAG